MKTCKPEWLFEKSFHNEAAYYAPSGVDEPAAERGEGKMTLDEQVSCRQERIKSSLVWGKPSIMKPRPKAGKYEKTPTHACLHQDVRY